MRYRCTVVAVAAAILGFFTCGPAFGTGKAAHHLPKTALAAYQKHITDRIGQRWYSGVTKDKDSIAVGTVTTSFRVESDGRVTNFKVTSNTSNQVFASICTAAVLESRLPPIPDAVKRELHHDFLEWEDMKFTMYPN